MDRVNGLANCSGRYMFVPMQARFRSAKFRSVCGHVISLTAACGLRQLSRRNSQMKATACLLIAIGTLAAQVPNPTGQQTMPADTSQPMPIFKVTVVSRTTKAINYHHRTGTTHIDFRGTELLPPARGYASVQSQMGSTKVSTELTHMSPANQYGPEYMTYVLWAITPEGRAMNLGEVVLEGDHAKLLSTTDLQTFGLIVTAEPYFAVTQPSDVVVAENFVTNDTSGTIEAVDAKFELLERGQYVMDRGRYMPIRVNPKG